ncbi:MAG TPA: DUF4172 domain-containing protein, partial [Rhabdochlamydiaceae bacterium]|nr:DUF4172 domain-containing protein [Rhabdochlamydiaceae bacterium]
MRWNWQLPEWPKFSYDVLTISEREKRFLLQIGSASAFLKNIEHHEYHRFVVEILSSEGLESSKIEGELLDRESLQSSIKQHFGLHPRKKENNKESRMAKLLCDVYETFAQPLSHEMVWRWHLELFKEQSHIVDSGRYRTHAEPMQIVSNRFDSTRIPKEFQNLVFDKASAPDLQQAQPTRKQAMCKHMVDGRGYKDG